MEHENRLRLIWRFFQSRSQAVRHKAGHRPGKVGVHDQSVGWVGLSGGANPDGPEAVEEDFLHFFPETDFDAQLSGDARHAIGHRSAPTDRVKNPMLVFEEGQDGKETWAAVGRHPEVLRLKREGKANSGIAEVAGQLLIEREPGMQREEASPASRRENRSRHPRKGVSRQGMNC